MDDAVAGFSGPGETIKVHSGQNGFDGSPWRTRRPGSWIRL